MSCTSPLTVASTIRPLPSSPVDSMCGSRYATAAFITSADCSTNGSCICPEPNSSPTVFIPDSSVSLMIASGGVVCIASSRSASSPLRSPSTIRRSSRSNSGSAASSCARDSRDDAADTPSNSAISFCSGSYPSRRRSYTRSSAVSRCSSGIRAIGRIFDACTIAVSSPACTHSCRNTEFSTCRAAGFSPNDTFEMPRVKCTRGCRRLISRIASIVSMASRRTSSCPVEIGNVRASTTMSSSPRPQLPVRSAISRSAMRTLCSAVRA